MLEVLIGFGMFTLLQIVVVTAILGLLVLVSAAAGAMSAQQGPSF